MRQRRDFRLLDTTRAYAGRIKLARNQRGGPNCLPRSPAAGSITGSFLDRIGAKTRGSERQNLIETGAVQGQKQG